MSSPPHHSVFLSLTTDTKDSYIRITKLIMVVCTACYSPLKFILYPLVLCCVWLFGWLRHVMMCICMLTLSTCYDVYAHLVFHLSCHLWVAILYPLIIVIVKKLQIVVCLPTEHVGVHSLKHVRAFQIELEFGSASF